MRRILTTSSTSPYITAADGLKYFLKDYRQILLADAYVGYNGVVVGNGIVRAGCWAHLRRKVIEAEKAAPDVARQAVELIRALYAVEKQASGLSMERRLHLRQTQSAPVLAQRRSSFDLERAAAAPPSYR